jgi:hypothetical protein
LNRQDAKDAKKSKVEMQNAKHAIQNAKLKNASFPGVVGIDPLFRASIFRFELHVLHFEFCI